VAIRTVFEGVLVGLDEKSYDSFEAADGQTISGGTTRLVFVGSTAGRPEALKVKDPALWSQLRDVGVGTLVRFTVDLIGMRRSGEFRVSVVGAQIAAAVSNGAS
jgi:hypothetical protein